MFFILVFIAFLLGAAFGVHVEQDSVRKSINAFGKFRINDTVFSAREEA